MLRTLRFQRLRLSMLKKPNGLNRQRTNSGNLKYIIRVPSNVKENAQFDKYNGNSLWANDILKELESLMSMSLFKKLLSSLRKSRAKRY